MTRLLHSWGRKDSLSVNRRGPQPASGVECVSTLQACADLSPQVQQLKSLQSIGSQRLTVLQRQITQPESFRAFCDRVHDEVVIPMKTGKIEASTALKALITEFPFAHEEYSQWWAHLMKDGYFSKDDGFKEYPGPIWAWPLQSSGPLPRKNDNSIDHQMAGTVAWKSWETEGDEDFLMDMQILSEEFAALTKDLGSPDFSEEDGQTAAVGYLDRNIERREQDLEESNYVGYGKNKREKSLNGVRKQRDNIEQGYFT